MQKDFPITNDEFTKDVFDFLYLRGIKNLKIPYVAGRELNLLELYKAVLERGGGEEVTCKKLWKDIAIQFQLPDTCTSASFILKKHYQQYLLAYEQQKYFNKKDTEVITNISGQRQLQLTNNNIFMQIKGKYKNISKYNEKLFKQPKKYKTKRNKNTYLNKESNDLKQLFQYILPSEYEIKRILLAFESKVFVEIRYALNSLNLFSCSTYAPFYLDNYEGLYYEFEHYFLFLYDKYINSEYIQKSFNNNQDNISENFIYESSSNKKSIISSIDMLEHIKMCISITRNFLMLKTNELFLAKRNKFIYTILNLFTLNKEYELNKLLINVMTNFTKYIHINNKYHDISKHYLDKIIDSINSEKEEEYEYAIEHLNNLLLNHENHSLLEHKLPLFLNKLVSMLLSTSSQTVQICLEILATFSKMKLNTKILLAKHPDLFTRLIAIVSSSYGEYQDNLINPCIIIINKLIIGQITRMQIKFSNTDLFFEGSNNNLA